MRALALLFMQEGCWDVMQAVHFACVHKRKRRKIQSGTKEVFLLWNGMLQKTPHSMTRFISLMIILWDVLFRLYFNTHRVCTELISHPTVYRWQRIRAWLICAGSSGSPSTPQWAQQIPSKAVSMFPAYKGIRMVCLEPHSPLKPCSLLSGPYHLQQGVNHCQVHSFYLFFSDSSGFCCLAIMIKMFTSGYTPGSPGFAVSWQKFSVCQHMSVYVLNMCSSEQPLVVATDPGKESWGCLQGRHRLSLGSCFSVSSAQLSVTDFSDFSSCFVFLLAKTRFCLQI